MIDSSVEYARLIQEVAKVDRKAALWMANKLPGYNKKHPVCSFLPDGNLARCFVWEETPQGHDYWADICREIWRL